MARIHPTALVEPQAELGDDVEVAAYAVFLCSDAAKSVTGSAPLIDGGWTAR